MGFEGIFVSALILFALIYFAVRLAINPLLHSQEVLIDDNQDFDLIKLRDMEILNNTELEEVIKLYQNNNTPKEGPKIYQKYFRILIELKEMGYLNDGEYNERLEKLRNYIKNY